MATRSELEEKRNIAKSALERAEKELANYKELTPAQKMAELIHSKMCHRNHAGGCGWYYESWNPEGYTMSRYLRKANLFISAGMTYNELEQFLEILNS